jgi:hypothetical protein
VDEKVAGRLLVERGMDRLSSMLPIGPADTDLHRGARRTAQRFALNAEVEVVSPAQATGIAINASAGGMRVALDRPIAVGEPCLVCVTTAPGRVSVEHAVVVWVREAPDGWLLGLRFVEPN